MLHVENGEERRDRREIKLETSNISPLGAVAILRAISIRDVVIENERALSSYSSSSSSSLRVLDAGENFACVCIYMYVFV